MYKLSLEITKDNTRQLAKALRDLGKMQLQVGFPEATSERPSSVPGEKRTMSNPDLAYLNENGSAAAHIPPRPFLTPGLDTVREELAQHLTTGITSALEGKSGAMEAGFHRAGLRAVSGVKNYMVAGVPPVLSPVTLANRRRAGIRGTTPLIASGSLFRALTYVVTRKP